jgi:flagellar basal-body rod protein FlgG
MSVISNNLANVNTNGFKRDRAVFEDLMYQNVRQAGGQTSQDTELPSGLSLGTGVRLVATEKLHTQGNIVQTDSAMDIAVNGRGLFEVALPSGSAAYTRDGGFNVDSEGQLVTSSGYAVQPAITIPDSAQSVTIGADGTVSAMLAGNSSPTTIGTLQLTDFINPVGLQPIGENLFVETGASGPPQPGTPGLNGLGRLLQGSLETSNVNVVEEMISMIEAQRAYEMNSRAISTTDGMLQFLTNNV